MCLTSEMSMGWVVRWEPLLREGSGVPSLLGAPTKGLLRMLAAHPGNCVSSTTVLQSMKLGVDVNRHKEVIVKAISAVLLLLLKHFKLNHVYQVPAGPPFLSTGRGPQAVLLLQPRRTEALPFKPP